MNYEVTINRTFKAFQGLKSPIRDAKGLEPLQPAHGYDVTLGVTITFDERQLGSQGWFVDTDALDDAIDALCAHLASAKWTTIFEFRPTFELVTRWAYEKLAADIPQLSSVSLKNDTLGIDTRYAKL